MGNRGRKGNVQPYQLLIPHDLHFISLRLAASRVLDSYYCKGANSQSGNTFRYNSTA